MSDTRKCPDCGSPLQAFSPPATLGSQVELERRVEFFDTCRVL